MKSLQEEEEEGGDNKWMWHYGGLLVLAIVGGVLYPFEAHVEEWRRYIIDGIYYIWLIYMIAAAPFLFPVLKNLRAKENRINSVELWVLSIYYGCLIVWFAYRTAHYTSYIAGALSFSFVLYIAILLWSIRKKETYTNFQKSGRYEGRSIDPAEANRILALAETEIIDNELFKNPTLKLSELAKTLNLPGHRMSQILNEHLNKNFPTYINTFRINKAKELILKEGMHLSLEGVGYECGFNSKSTFYATFKKMTGQTPARYREEALALRN